MLKNLHWNKTLKRPGAAKGPSHCNYCCNYENCNIEFVELNNYDPPFAAFQDAANQYAINWMKPPLFMSHSPVRHKSTVSKLAEYYPNKIFKPVGSKVRRTCISKSLSKSEGVSEVWDFLVSESYIFVTTWCLNSCSYVPNFGGFGPIGTCFQTRNEVFWAEF